MTDYEKRVRRMNDEFDREWKRDVRRSLPWIIMGWVFWLAAIAGLIYFAAWCLHHFGIIGGAP